ncbi:MAG: acetyltransferase [Mariprofundaceae bacterium]|nr:acetyltransferase [Mariprofundaceae bacterium]
MAQFDVFNGDADGLCALHQLRLANPVKSELITGVKRDVGLLRCVSDGKKAKQEDIVCVLDISLDQNRQSLLHLLDRGIKVLWFDHHFAGDIPDHPNLEAHINTAPDVCTSLLVSHYLQDKYLPWAVVAAFGDNLHDAANHAATVLHLEQSQLQQLCQLGDCLNYNGYGITVDDLYFHPSDLYRRMEPFSDPFAFIKEEDAFQVLRKGMDDDRCRVMETAPEFEDASTALFLLPDEAWARRVSGVFSNELARRYPTRAHAVAMQLSDGENRGTYRISVRAPLVLKEGADELCRQFPTGGGRKAAAGINALPQKDLDAFMSRFRATFST